MKKLITLLLLLICTTTFADNKQNQKPNIDSVIIHEDQSTIDIMHYRINQLEKDIDVLSEKGKEDFSTYRDTVAWAVGIIGVILVSTIVFAPILINMRREKEIDDKLDKLDKKISIQDDKMNDLIEKSKGMSIIKSDINKIKVKVEESERKAAKSRKGSLINKLFAETYNEKDNYKAIQLLSDIIRLDSNYAKAYNNRADLYREQKEFDNAIKDCEKALSIDSNSFTCLDTMGHIHLDMAKYDMAIDYFNRAIIIKPNLWESYAKRGKAYEELAKIENDPIKKEDYEKKSKEDIELAIKNGFNMDKIV